MRCTVALFIALSVSAGSAPGQIMSYGAAGSSPSAITAVRDQFRSDLGGGIVSGANGSFGGLRREINWDGVGSSFAAPNALPGNFFNVNSPRGAVFSTPGTGFQVSAATTDASGAIVEFGNINPTYPTPFQPFSPQRLFTPLGSNTFDVTFFVAGTVTAADVSGFALVLADVDLADSTTVRFFDAQNTNLGVLIAPSFDGGLSFVGGIVPSGQPRISRVRVTMGNVPLGPNDNNASADLVVADDFIYSEPLARPLFRNGFE